MGDHGLNSPYEPIGAACASGAAPSQIYQRTGAGSIAVITPAAKAKASSPPSDCAHTAMHAPAATHKARTTGHTCRVERWRIGRLRAALRRMGLLLEVDGEGLDAGLRKLAALRHPCLLGLYDPVGYGEREGCSPQEEERSIYIVMEAGPCAAAVVCAGKEGGDCGLLARRLLEGGHEEGLESVCRALVWQLARGLAHLHAHGAAHGRVALGSVVLGPAMYPWQARLRLLPPPAPSVAAVDTPAPEGNEAVATPEEDVRALALLIRQLLTAAGLPTASVGVSCDALLSHMTHPDPTARPSVEEVLAHPWLASSLPAADYYDVDLAPGQEVAIQRFPLPSPQAGAVSPPSPSPSPRGGYLELTAIALGPRDGPRPLGLALARDDVMDDALLVLPCPPAHLLGAAGAGEEEEGKLAGGVGGGNPRGGIVGVEALRRLVAAVAPPPPSREGEGKPQEQGQEQSGPRGVWVTPPPAASASPASGGADGAWHLHKSLLAAAASLLPPPASPATAATPSSSNNKADAPSSNRGVTLALPLALYAAHCPRLPRRALAHEIAAFAALLAASTSSQGGGSGGVRRLLLVAADPAELAEALHAFHALASHTTPSSGPSTPPCPWAPTLHRLAAAVAALVDTAAFPFLLPTTAHAHQPDPEEAAADRRAELRAYARSLAPRPGEEGTRAAALQCCLWAGTLARRAVRWALTRPDAYRVTEVWGGVCGGPMVLAVVNDARVDPWVEALVRGRAKAVGGGGRWARLLTPLDAVESLAALRGLLQALAVVPSVAIGPAAPVAPVVEEEGVEDGAEEVASTTTTTAAAALAATGGLAHGWGLGEDEDEEDEDDAEGEADAYGGGAAWGGLGGGEYVRRLSLLSPGADPGLDASVETVVERFPRCWLEEPLPPAVAGTAARAREAPF